ncbi:hypothetical protein WHX55_10970 [Pseudomonas fluorescens]|uniref:hypothetical protein n=1 Tax=Pseudomonas fluorescens TaxID=294 RepID=UPI003246D55A
MIEYPKFLPLPQREGYGFQSVSPIARSDLQSGRARQRRRFTSVPTVATVTWLLNDTEAQLFEGWFEHILLSGSLWFQCLLKTPLGLDDHRARFIDIYDGPNLVGVSHWRFTAKVELFKRPILDAGWIITVPDYVAMADIFDRAINHEWPAG